MTSFDKREKSFENKFKHDQDLQFKVEARRNKLLGIWAAELMGIADADALAYAKEVIASDFDEPGDEDVLRKVLADLEARNAGISAHLLRKKMDELMVAAKAQVMEE